ncbi:LuxR C-terminal-related transcriptional regulator [Pseudomonas asiatica]|uniref:response regulator transcription factor n=1 Tax=Pseudomonas asiatica TaxID=2219225 RepID=UPI00256FB465|nr:helix-turn-helix transcriptional regulator [Pseudomonas asiatica]WJD72288.1 LuxR C-terminal-related transcriptional regulator [Pseudomonas asiatica]
MPNVITALGSARFFSELDAALQGVSPFDQSCIFLYPAGQLPDLVHDNLQVVSELGAMQRYLSGTYLLDPVYTACTHGRSAGWYRMAELAPDAFFEGEYFNSPDVHPCISLASGSLAEEIVFLSHLPDGTYAAYSLMRCNGSAGFCERELLALRCCQPVMEALCRQHYAGMGAGGGRVLPTPAIADQLTSALRGFAADLLTAREQEIVGLILRGHSSVSIALNLSIAEGTVKNHRKHLYCKLGVGSQSELFHLFVSHLLGAQPAGHVQAGLSHVGAAIG